ncbi:hypothetical protein ACVGA5_001342 [Morganella morganii]|uniref:hypothetical protein n=1 Tax=Morganella morganii TaxID=582 RepID=UPI000D9A9337|nr:hypothetical protein [Morganella morganii]EKW3934566.1 hypothetical protein [Morganella morganii]EKW3939270.1 hypothetical protein [Morganella morganii]SPX73501.1 Uncharacterised protein [Morganella morganii]HCR3434675.1 hypothetical protein [Morganella morganii]
MNLTPEQLETIIEKAVEKAITKSLIRYLKLTIGIPVVVFIFLAVIGYFLYPR